ncbi:MAG TPA: ABC transporter permease [Gemmatimonadaceae bacterium]|nr:ABC transporter permease [Gemmatimonadaceae bacterium]
MELVFTEVRHAVRRLSRRPVLALVVVLTLALGIGATTAIFSVIDAVLFRVVPYPNADRLVVVSEEMPSMQLQMGMSDVGFLRLRGHPVLEDAAAYTSRAGNLTGEGDPEWTRASFVSADLFAVLGLPLSSGRGFRAEEDLPGGPDVAVISHALWTRRFGGRADVVGQRLVFDGIPRTIVGIAPAEFAFPARQTDLWLPLRLDPASVNPFSRSYGVIARLRQEITREAATRELTARAMEVSREFAGGHGGRAMEVRSRLTTLRERAVGDLGPMLIALAGTVLCVLLIACANVANLMLTNAESRGREMVVRQALGAGRLRLLAPVVAEGTVLALAGGLAGVAVAFAGTRWLATRGPADVPRLAEATIDWRVLLFALGVSAFSGLLVSLVPARRVARGRETIRLRESGAGTAARHRARATFVGVQVALAIVLLTGAGLMVRTAMGLAAVDPGFRERDALTFRLTLPAARYPVEAVAPFMERLEARLAALPGVVAVGATGSAPLSGNYSNMTFVRDGDDFRRDGTNPQADYASVTPGYFTALGIPLREGRPFTEADRLAPEPPVIISESVARRFFPAGRSPVGERIRLAPQLPARPVVGVVGDVAGRELRDASQAMLYYPHMPVSGPGSVQRTMTVILTSGGNPTSLASAARREVAALDPQLAVYDVRTVRDVLRSAFGRESFVTALLAGFAALALVLGGLGVYGVASAMVAQRTREIGVRIALGATAARVTRLVLRQSMTAVAVGAALGVAGALGLSRYLAALLYGVQPRDAATVFAAVLVFAAVGLAAALLPARRATRVDPNVAIRAE